MKLDFEVVLHEAWFQFLISHIQTQFLLCGFQCGNVPEIFQMWQPITKSYFSCVGKVSCSRGSSDKIVGKQPEKPKSLKS